MESDAMQALREELAATRHALWAAIESSGGRLTVPKVTWESYRPRENRVTLAIFGGTGTRIMINDAEKKPIGQIL